jgi:ergothioneine biosynthesis protein EgtC
MCRFVLYLGPPITLDLLTTRPAHSIIHQSFQSRIAEEPLNGDGFGIAWYVPEISPEPAQFRSIQPAWNNVNLLHLARVSRSPAILAHVRAASPGFGVSESNCHPFAAGRFAFMHNGTVAEFHRLKRTLRSELSDDAYLSIHGTTDSEHMFALFRDHVARRQESDEAERLAQALCATIADVQRWTRAIGATRPSRLNLAVCDGECAVISRFCTDTSEGASLYLRTGSRFIVRGEECLMVDEGRSRETVIVASEPITEEPGWMTVPRNHLVVIHADHRVELRGL